MQREKFPVKYSSPQHHRSSSAPGHNKLCTVTMVTGQTECYQHHSRAHAMFFPPLQPSPWNNLQMILILTYAYGDVCWPLIVVLAGDSFLSNQLEAKLALKPQDSSIWEAVPFSYSVERSSRVTATLFVYFCKNTVSEGDINILVSFLWTIGRHCCPTNINTYINKPNKLTEWVTCWFITINTMSQSYIINVLLLYSKHSKKEYFSYT